MLYALNIFYGGLFGGCAGASAAKGLCPLCRCSGVFECKKPSVSRAVKELSKKKCLLKKDDGTLSLTEQGWQIAQQIYEKHQFLPDSLLRPVFPMILQHRTLAGWNTLLVKQVKRSCLDKCPGGDTIGEIIIMKLNEDEKRF